MSTATGKTVGRWWTGTLLMGLLMGFGCGEKAPPPTSAESPAAGTLQKTPPGEPVAQPASPGSTETTPPTTTPPLGPQTQASVSTRIGPPLTSVAADEAHFPARRHTAKVLPSQAPADFKGPSPEIECYGNFETMGVIATLPPGMKVEEVGGMRCYLNVGGQWQPQQNPVRVGATNHFASSIFWLGPDSGYQVKVEALDTRGATIQTWYGEGRTRTDELAAWKKRVIVHVAPATPGETDPGDGSLARPYRSIAQAVKNAGASAEIQLRAGVYYEGDIVLPRKNPGGILAISGQPGAIIDGSNPDLADAGIWKKETDGLYSHAYEGKCQCVVLEDKKTGALTRLLPIFTAEELRTRTVAKRGGFAGSTFAKEAITGAFATDGKTAWLLPPEPLENYRVHIARATKAFILEGCNNARFSGLTVRYFGKQDYAAIALVYDSSEVVFENCHFLFNDVGIWIKGDSNNVTVQNCDFLDGVANFPFGMQKVGGCPISFEAGAVNVDSKWSGRGLVIRGNHIENQFDGVHLTSWKVDTAVTNEVDFYNNVILNCVDDFIEADGFSRNVRIFDNYMRHALTGVSIAQALDGPTYVCYNVIADCGTVPATTREGNGGYPFKTNGGDGADIGSGEVFFYHNTAYTTDPDSRAMWVKRPNWRKLTFRNNIWYGKKHGFECWKNPPSPMDFDYDNLFSADPAAPLVVLNYKTKIATLAEVRAQLQWLQHGISADPSIVDETAGDYSLKPGSPCIDAGVAIPGVNHLRSLGRAPDLGAFESAAEK